MSDPSSFHHIDASYSTVAVGQGNGNEEFHHNSFHGLATNVAQPATMSTIQGTEAVHIANMDNTDSSTDIIGAAPFVGNVHDTSGTMHVHGIPTFESGQHLTSGTTFSQIVDTSSQGNMHMHAPGTFASVPAPVHLVMNSGFAEHQQMDQQQQQQQEQQQFYYHQTQVPVSAPSDGMMVNSSHSQQLQVQPNMVIMQQPEMHHVQIQQPSLMYGQQDVNTNRIDYHVHHDTELNAAPHHEQLHMDPATVQPAELSWHDFFVALQAHQNRTGSIYIEPNTNPPLEEWVASQRKMYQDAQKGLATSLSNERKLLLDALGFDWDGNAHASNGAGVDEVQDPHGVQQQHGEEQQQHMQQQEAQGQEYTQQTRVYHVDIGTVEDFNERLQQLQSFKDVHGHCDIPHDYNNDEHMPNIAKWSIDQRQFYHRGYLTQDRVDALLTMGFDFHIQDGSDFPFPTFDDRIRQLEHYKAVNGDIKIPRNAGPELLGLGEWLHAQKLSIQRMEMGESTLMTPERCKLLLDLGIDLTIPADSMLTLETAEHLTEEEKEHNRALKWDEKYHELKIYKHQNGHTNVPRRSKRDPSKDALGEWVHFQRRQHRNLLTGKNSTMSINRKKSLDYLGFQWTRTYDTNQTTRSGLTYSTDIKVAVEELVQKVAKLETAQQWLDRFAEFEKYVQTHGNGNVPVIYRENPLLARWVQRQREMYVVWRQAADQQGYHQFNDSNNPTIMTEEKYMKLLKAGFQFVPQAHDGNLGGTQGALDLTKMGEEEIPEEDDDIIEIFAGYEQCEQYPEDMESSNVETTHHTLVSTQENGLVTEHTIEQQIPVTEHLPGMEGETRKTMELNESDVREILNVKDDKEIQDNIIQPQYEQQVDNTHNTTTQTIEQQFGDNGGMQNIEHADMYNMNQGSQLQQQHEHPLEEQHRQMTPILSLRRLTAKVKVQWEERVLELVQFKMRKFHCNVPAKWKPNPGLADWVWRQRVHYRRYRQGLASVLTSHRICQLSDLGFDFMIHDQHGLPVDEVHTKVYAPTHRERVQSAKKVPKKAGVKTTPKSRFKEGKWLESLAKVVKYKEENGNCNVPRKWKRDPTLGEWVHFQRRQFRLRQLNRRNHMTDERIHKLESIGFEWSRGNSSQSSYMRSVYDQNSDVHDQQDTTTVDTSEGPTDMSQVAVGNATVVVDSHMGNTAEDVMQHQSMDQNHVQSFLHENHHQDVDYQQQMMTYDGQKNYCDRGNEHVEEARHIQYDEYQSQEQSSHQQNHQMQYQDQQNIGDNYNEARV